jgi:hypothetical protein
MGPPAGFPFGDLREYRRIWFACLTSMLDAYMRSAAFLNMLPLGMRAFTMPTSMLVWLRPRPGDFRP